MGMRRPEHPFLPEGINDIDKSAREFHEALVRRGAVVVRKSGKIPDDAFTELFDHMRVQSLRGTFKTLEGKQILYLPIHLNAKNLINLVSKQGLPAFNMRLAQLAATVPTWVERDTKDRARRRNVPDEPYAANDQEAAILSMLNYDLKFGISDNAAHVIRKNLTRFGNPRGPLDTYKTPRIVPVFNITGRLPDNFQEILGEYDPLADLTNEERMLALVCRSIVDLTYYMHQSHGQRKPTQYILAADLRPFDIFNERYDSIKEPWMVWGPNDELHYEYRSMNVSEV